MNNKFISNRNLGNLIYTNNLGYEVYINSFTDMASKRQSYNLHIVDPEGGVSEKIVLKRSAFLTNKSCLNCLLDYEGEFGKEDIIQIYMNIQNGMHKLQKSSFKVYEKVPFNKVYELVCEYIREKSTDNTCKEIFIEGNRGYIETPYIGKMISDIDLYDYKRKELLSMLAEYDLLVCSPNRSYDYYKKIDGKLKHFCCVKLPDTIYAATEQEVA